MLARWWADVVPVLLLVSFFLVDRFSLI